MHLIISFCVITAAYALPYSNSEILIIGGENAEKNEFPWLVHFEVSTEDGQSRFCSGSLIDLDHVLTSASCVIGAENPITVTAGDHTLNENDETEQEVTSEEIIIHDDFNSGNKLENDIALIRLSSSLEVSDAVQPIGLASSSFDPESAGHGIAAGWGEVSTSNETEGQLSQVLQKAEVTIHNQFSCKTIPGSNFPAKQFCTFDNNKGGYLGDIGGPLICNDDFICGVLSTSIIFNNRTSVAGGYVEVSLYLDWIEANTGIIIPTTERTTTRSTTPTTTTPTTTTQTTPEPSTTTGSSSTTSDESSVDPSTTTSEGSSGNPSTTTEESNTTTMPTTNPEDSSTTPQSTSTTPDSSAPSTVSAGLLIVLASFLISIINS
ncbi:Granzyme H [Orchesella cincta]|uniref:Granzyme H n=1 Tax=Orchesella cincta TaxID=48709 RepID=A0A1D2MKB5_ORCCI|nr:Granzyme H [Orchesella cincta]